MNFQAFSEAHCYDIEAPTDVYIGLERYSFCTHEQTYKTSTGNILALHGITSIKVEKSFTIDGKLYHKVRLLPSGSNQDITQVDYQLRHNQTYIIDAQAHFVMLPWRYAPQKLVDIFGKITLFWEQYYMCVTHTGQTYVLDSSLHLVRDALRRDIRNIFKRVSIDWEELVFCEVFEYGKWITNAVLKKKFTPLTGKDGKEIISIKKYDFRDGTIEIEGQNEDGKEQTLSLIKK